MAHSVTPGRTPGATGAEEPSVGTLVQSAMADVSTLIRGEVELAKAEISTSAKRAGISVGLFAAAGVLVAFAGIYLFITIAELLDVWLPRWVAFLIVTVFLLVVAGIAALVGKKMLKKIEKPERTIESLRELPEVMHREASGARHRDVPVVSGGKVELHDKQPYSV
ncbi:phage holin family protein [Blastococcus sp. TF02-8]|uniref:phage holin family protein n=1 Tax=Blastococcus sp. TF02-8 TaxID=2250574 RepID=UPI000DE889FE|nr:phage holin family protein [Blastococcus sp. TF02-8]RBY96155.1 phage holin family protein [Blastococcus sp. TF02-8]